MPSVPGSPLGDSLQQVTQARLALSRADARILMDALLDHDDPVADPRVPALLGALAARGETPEELAGFVDSLRARVTPLPLTGAERDTLVDTCGTGGDGTGTFNISTAAALVAASAGARVAKHGNRAVTSRAGSADVLEAMGIPIELSPQEAAEALRRHGFVFLPAPAYHPALRRMMPLRRALGVRTLFNLVGPLANPAGARAQVLGVYAARVVPVVAQALALLGTRHALVVHGSGLDEFSLNGPTLVGQVLDGEAQFGNVGPEQFGLTPASPDALAGGDARENAGILHSIFAGEPGPRRDAVIMNAAAVLVTADLARDFADGARQAASAIDSGQTAALVAKLTSKS